MDVDATELITEPESMPTSLLEGFETAPSRQITTTSSKIGAGVLWGLGTGVVIILVGLLFWVISTNLSPDRFAADRHAGRRNTLQQDSHERRT